MSSPLQASCPSCGDAHSECDPSICKVESLFGQAKPSGQIHSCASCGYRFTRLQGVKAGTAQAIAQLESYKPRTSILPPEFFRSNLANIESRERRLRYFENSPRWFWEKGQQDYAMSIYHDCLIARKILKLDIEQADALKQKVVPS